MLLSPRQDLNSCWGWGWAEGVGRGKGDIKTQPLPLNHRSLISNQLNDYHDSLGALFPRAVHKPKVSHPGRTPCPVFILFGHRYRFSVSCNAAVSLAAGRFSHPGVRLSVDYPWETTTFSPHWLWFSHYFPVSTLSFERLVHNDEV